jgi:predicted house-cleaning noncanonical NTP pyrophosphatase (MazG superfamily)
MRILFLTMVFLSSFCWACEQAPKGESAAPQTPDLSANEDKGLQAVVKHYGGQGHFSKATATSQSAPRRTFEIELSNSTFAEEQKHLLDFTASNMAYLFYKELNAAERSNYDEIHSIVILSDGQKTTTKFPVKDLDAVLIKMKLLEKIVALLKEKNYEALAPMINDTALVPFDKEELINNLKIADADYGDILSFHPFGFRRKKTTEGERILHLSGYLLRTKKNNEFSIDLAMDGMKEEVYLLQYVL